MESISIAYAVDGRPYEGILLSDGETKDPRPGLLLAPDWMGVSPQAIDSAQRFVGAGYVVFIADMYGTGKRPSNQDEAAALAQPLKANSAEARRRAAGALEVLRTEGRVRGLITESPPAAIGFCFGGSNVLELCRAGAELAAAVSIHGDLVASEPAAAHAIVPPILVLHGSADPVAPESQRHAFESEMTAARARWSMMIFGGAVHSFTDPGAAIAGVAMYDGTASRWAFRMTEQFLAESFSTTHT